MEAELDLRCTFCGSPLRVLTRAEGGAGNWEDIPDAIECDGSGCYATWKPDGTYVDGGKVDD